MTSDIDKEIEELQEEIGFLNSNIQRKNAKIEELLKKKKEREEDPLCGKYFKRIIHNHWNHEIKGPSDSIEVEYWRTTDRLPNGSYHAEKLLVSTIDYEQNSINHNYGVQYNYCNQGVVCKSDLETEITEQEYNEAKTAVLFAWETKFKV